MCNQCSSMLACGNEPVECRHYVFPLCSLCQDRLQTCWRACWVMRCTTGNQRCVNQHQMPVDTSVPFCLCCQPVLFPFSGFNEKIESQISSRQLNSSQPEEKPHGNHQGKFLIVVIADMTACNVVLCCWRVFDVFMILALSCVDKRAGLCTVIGFWRPTEVQFSNA